jgi:hypothetical protein
MRQIFYLLVPHCNPKLHPFPMPLPLVEDKPLIELTLGRKIDHDLRLWLSARCCSNFYAVPEFLVFVPQDLDEHTKL